MELGVRHTRDGTLDCASTAIEAWLLLPSTPRSVSCHTCNLPGPCVVGWHDEFGYWLDLHGAMRQLLFVVLVQQHHADEPDDRAFVREYADNIGAALHLRVQRRTFLGRHPISCWYRVDVGDRRFGIVCIVRTPTSATCMVCRLGGVQHIPGMAECLAREQKIAVDQVDQCHWLAAQLWMTWR